MENPDLKVVKHLASLGYQYLEITRVAGIDHLKIYHDFVQAYNEGRQEFVQAFREKHRKHLQVLKDRPPCVGIPEKCNDEIEETPEEIHHSLETDRKHAFIAEMNRQKEENPDNSFRWEFSRDDGRTISEQREDKLKEMLGE